MIKNIIFIAAMLALSAVIVYTGYHTRTYPAFGGEWLAGIAVMGVSIWAVVPGKEKA